MYVVYVLESLNDKKHYIGQTSDVNQRIQEHNQGRVRWTKAHRPWKILYVEEFENRTSAIKRERFLKSPAGWLESRRIKEGRGFHKVIAS
jgi:putative endonuclease